ncbi:MAG: DUF2283 domain-containing protein [Candidatus Sungbacteria bacterium]|nr:DUF2283 domain-containing protein [Candidatus Sungbacteria bacterium]
MKIRYDKEADAIYIRIKSAKIKKTVKIEADILADFDEKGNTCGIEILNASKQLPTKERSVEIGKRKMPIPAFA